MSGEMDLGELIRSMNAELRDGVFVFATTKDQAKVQAASALMVFHEAEGATLVLERAEAEKHQIEYEFPCRMITLNVHSALEAVGFIARIATHLASIGMGANPVSGFYHDHIFVPEARAEEALTALQDLAKG